MKTQAAIRVLLLAVGSRIVFYTVGITGLRGSAVLGVGLCRMATSEKPCSKEACCDLTVFHKCSVLGSGPQREVFHLGGQIPHEWINVLLKRLTQERAFLKRGCPLCVISVACTRLPSRFSHHKTLSRRGFPHLDFSASTTMSQLNLYPL